MYSTLIKNGTIIDGTGSHPVKMDIALEGDQIVAIDRNIPEKAYEIHDASGKIVTPGFVDVQNHSDSYWTLFDNPTFDSMLTQGFTTVLLGQCGASLAPLLSKESLLSVRKWHDLSGSNINWTTFSEYIEELSKYRFGCNVASLVGYSTLRRGLIGDAIRSLDRGELASIKAQLQGCLEAGAFGLSTGLSYSHEIIISELELYELVELVSKAGKLFSMHLRSEAGEVLDSLEEALDIGRHTDVNLKISHLKIRGEENAHLGEQLVEGLETAFHKGTNVHYDIYPYDSIWQVVYAYLPKWSISGGRANILEHINDPTDKKKLISELAEQRTRLQSLIVASTGNQLGMVGKTIADISKNTGLSTEEAFLELIKNAGSESLVFDSCVSPKLLADLLVHPQAIIATDGAGFAEVPRGFKLQDRLVHPRCFGSAPRFLKSIISTKKITLEEGIKKLTSLPAEKIGLKKRGVLKVGNFADIVVFDPETISDNASLMNPFQHSSGIDMVMVNGKTSVVGGVLNKNLSGYVLRKV